MFFSFQAQFKGPYIPSKAQHTYSPRWCAGLSFFLLAVWLIRTPSLLSAHQEGTGKPWFESKRGDAEGGVDGDTWIGLIIFLRGDEADPLNHADYERIAGSTPALPQPNSTPADLVRGLRGTLLSKRQV